MANTVVLVTNQDLGNTLEVDNTKLEVKVSQDSGNALTINADGLFSSIPDLGSMALEDTEDYLTKDDIESEYTKTVDLPADKFLNNAELVDDGETLRLTLSDDTTVDVSLADLVPIASGTGLKGRGTETDPVRVDTDVVSLKSELGSMAGESKDDYVREDELTVTLESLGGEAIGIIKAA